MRPSRAALVEHAAGTAEALRTYGLPATAKTQATGDVLGKVTALAGEGLPLVELQCALPAWLTDEAAWRNACAEEAATYQRILGHSSKISSARETMKAQLLTRLADEHRLVLAFDRHPITLAAVRAQLQDPAADVLIATGDASAQRRRVEQRFARDSRARDRAMFRRAQRRTEPAGAAALVHLDLPTTLRVAEQRKSAGSTMDSPHDRISVWWPEDGKTFATREIELLLTRRQASESLLGSNLPMPAFTSHEEDTVVPVEHHIRDLDRADLTWDGIRDALDPVRRLVHGEDALVSPDVYAEHRHTRHRVMARVAPVAARTPWAFLALSGTQHGAPRWLMLEGDPPRATVGVEAVAERVRAHLREDPPNVAFDEDCQRWLDRFLTAATQSETMLLPRRMQSALEQMAQMTAAWREQAVRQGDHLSAEQWSHLRKIARPASDDDDRLDPYLVGEVWWDQVRPLFANIRRARRRRYTRLRDLDALLRATPLDLPAMQAALRRVPVIEPVDKRVSAVIIGVPQ
jgi:hypothetical protein